MSIHCKLYDNLHTFSSLSPCTVRTRLTVRNSQYLATSDTINSSTIDPLQYIIYKENENNAYLKESNKATSNQSRI